MSAGQPSNGNSFRAYFQAKGKEPQESDAEVVAKVCEMSNLRFVGFQCFGQGLLRSAVDKFAKVESSVYESTRGRYRGLVALDSLQSPLYEVISNYNTC